MAKEVRSLKSWIEVAPAMVISPRKSSNSPKLETISEEEADEFEKDAQL
uniref:Uncharacterized protein n=1 Tax=Nelumbo nucifera TaxID=4432 RepID=A0A822YTC5_NELNU|nr:TPA_asm: hypothetical protein HUJ06_008015 [Nelumbo nucifera]